MTIVPKNGVTRPGNTSDIRRVMILADRPALFDPDIAELAELAKGLGLRIKIERFDLEENRYSSLVLG